MALVTSGTCAGCHGGARIRRMIKPLLYLHIVAGSVVLASMFIPAVTRKGGLLHRRAGWVFVVSMATVSISAIVLSAVRLLFDPNGQMSALFLGYLGILTGSSTSTGVRALRTKQRTAANLHWWDIGLGAVLGSGGVGLLAYGIARREVLLIAFAVVGILSSLGSLRYWLTTPSSRMHWWFEHMNAMLGGCIGGTTAFLVQLGNRNGGASMLMWLAPTLIGVPIIAVWNAYYHRHFARHAAPSPTAAITTAAAIAVMVCGGAPVRALAQEAPSLPARFEVATIKRNPEAPRLTLQGPFRTYPGGRFVATNMTLRDIIRVAYATEGVMLSAQQVSGGPDWINSDRFDIVAQAGRNADGAEGRAMLQALLTERFGLKMHTESRSLPVLHLVTARSDGRLGPEITPSQCGPAPAPPPATLDDALRLAMTARETRPCLPLRLQQGSFLVEGVTPKDLGSILANFPAIDRPVVDKTGLDQTFDFRLTFVGADVDPSRGPNIFTALKEQLGLELRSGHDTLPVFVIDEAMAPTED